MTDPRTLGTPAAVPQPLQIAFFGECMLELNGRALGAMQQSYGGDTFNTAVYLARCAGPAVAVHYATALGDDAISATLLQRWQQDGLQLDLVRQLPGRLPGLYQISLNAQGERSFSFWREGSAAKSYFKTPVTPLEARAAEWDVLYFSGISLAILSDASRQRLLALAEQLRRRGARVVFDNNYRPALWPSLASAQEAFRRAFTVADTLLITADDHQALFGLPSLPAAVADAQRLPARELLIKRGAAPTLVRLPSGSWLEVPTEPVAQVVDTTAAGDSFAAGYLACRLLGAAADAATGFGNRLAARVIQYRGAIIEAQAMRDLDAARFVAASAAQSSVASQPAGV